MRKVVLFSLGFFVSSQMWAAATCEDTNTNESFVLGNIRVKEPMHFVYSSFNEPVLAYDVMGGKENPVFQAIKRAIKAVEQTVRARDDSGTQQDGKAHNLFSVEITDAPFHPDQANATVLHAPYVDDNYYSAMFSGDGVNSIGWVDFKLDDPAGQGIRELIGAITYTVWNDANEIIERDIVLQNNEFIRWAINTDLTAPGNHAVDCSDVLDVQGVVTHFLAHASGLRPVTNDSLPENGDETDATLWDPYAPFALSGRIVLANSAFGRSLPTHRWQTLTPGDRDGLAAAAPLKGDKLSAPLAEVTPEGPQVVLHFDFEDISAGIARDSSGNGLDGTIVGAAGQTVSANGSQAIDLSNGEYIDLDGPNFPRAKIPQDAYTLGVWLNFSAETPPIEPTIFDTRSSLGYTASNTLLVLAVPGAVIQSSAALPTSYPIVPIVGQLVPATLPTGEWFHYAVTHDRAEAKATVYVNGIQVGEAPMLADLPLASNWFGGALIGQWVFPKAYPLNGMMDEFVLTNYAMGPTEITQLMNGVIAPPSP